ncbi:MAG TPA: hypothetical protein VGR18_01365 [Rubrobacter sp.]|nr:hypothetical protein [Rubrobacter sp.]
MAGHRRGGTPSRERQVNRGRCEHATFPVKVLPVAGGKKIAHCTGRGRSGPVRNGSAEALAALRRIVHSVAS